ncbi:hypothetical protein TNCT_705271 [Trichonephila clavata]|uniref:Uncharacterized protein n=1 Tax=Trichonephila clavata TaxID=2740835 RepID=A0A8X6HGN9_TRICU|nr:hypothetical protein TNCT_705271 [Trichonephila clavata]
MLGFMEMKLLICLHGRTANFPLPLPLNYKLPSSSPCSRARSKLLGGLHLDMPCIHALYAAKFPGMSLQCACPRLVQTTLSRLRTGHIKSLIFNESEKTVMLLAAVRLWLLPPISLYLCGAIIE